MSSDRDLVLYTCVADGATIIADFVRDDLDLETLAVKCLHHTPPNHAVYSHTVDNRSYVFLIDERFVLFGIFDEGLEKRKRLWLLKKMRDGFDEILMKREGVLVEKFGYKSLQGEMSEVFRRLLDGEIERIGSVNGLVRFVVDEKAKNVVPMLVGKGVIKKKKRGAAVELNGESRETNSLDEDMMSKESLGFINKHGNGGTGVGRQRAARSSWRKRAWIVLFIDVVVCLVLFGVWLFICRGFKCLNG